jgi:outer membrane immunogenic protein
MPRALLAAALGLGLIASASPARAQDAPRWELSAAYDYVHTNAPPGGCGCFSMNGGSASLAYDWKNWLSFVGDFGAVHAGNVLGSGQDLTLVSYEFGPQITYRAPHQFAPFAHVFLGGAHATGWTFPSGESFASKSESAFALKAGGGLDVNVNQLLAVRIIDLDYYFTQFPNGVNGRQNNFQVSVGVVFHFGSR